MEFHASIPQWYGLTAIFITATWQIFRVLRWVFRLFLPFAFFCVEWLAATLRRKSPWTAVSEFEIIFILIYVTANTVCMSLYVKDYAEAAARSGILATINLVPLLVGTQLSDVADFLGLTLRIPKIIHRWISCITLLEGAIHIVISTITAGWKSSSREISGIIVSQRSQNVIQSED